MNDETWEEMAMRLLGELNQGICPVCGDAGQRYPYHCCSKECVRTWAIIQVLMQPERGL